MENAFEGYMLDREEGERENAFENYVNVFRPQFIFLVALIFIYSELLYSRYVLEIYF